MDAFTLALLYGTPLRNLEDMLLLGMQATTAHTSSSCIFSLDSFDDRKCRSLFRFTKIEIDELADAMKWVGKQRTGEGYVYDSVFGLRVALGRLAFPVRWEDLVDLFGC